MITWEDLPPRPGDPQAELPAEELADWLRSMSREQLTWLLAQQRITWRREGECFVRNHEAEIDRLQREVEGLRRRLPAVTGTGWTSHGHPIPGRPQLTARPAEVARCGGPALCRVCAQEANAHQGAPDEWARALVRATRVGSGETLVVELADTGLDDAAKAVRRIREALPEGARLLVLASPGARVGAVVEP